MNAGHDVDDTTPGDGRDPVGDRIRHHLHRTAGAVQVPLDAMPPGTLRRLAAQRAADRHHRRVAGVSMTGAAAVALAVALVVNAQAPQQVDSADDPAARPPAGVATGSSTGSATGAAKGWRSRDVALGPSPAFIPVTVDLPDTTTDELSGAWAVGTERGEGRPAPELAVLADLREGTPVRFVVASPQDADHLTMGRGGRDTTIAGRPARVLVGNHGWYRLIWSMDDDTRVFVQSHGLGFAELEEMLGTLERQGDDSWTMDPGRTGLSPVESEPPVEQSELHVEWRTGDPAEPDITTTMRQTDAGQYEFWASLAGGEFQMSVEMSVVKVGLGDGTEALGLLAEPTSGGNWARVVVLDPGGTVVTVERHRWNDDSPATEDLLVAAPKLLRRLEEPEWSRMLFDAVVAAQEWQAGSRTSVDESGAGAGPTTTTGPPTPAHAGSADPDAAGGASG